MRSVFEVTTPAADLNLLTLAEMRAAVGIEGSESDSKLETLGLRVGEIIARTCNVRADGAATPSLRLESITETFLNPNLSPNLVLSRRPIVSVDSILEDSVSLVFDDDYEISKAAGILRRLDVGSGRYAYWGAGCWGGDWNITVAYTAGWDEVPYQLRLAAEKLFQDYWSENSRGDLSVREIEIPGVIRRVYGTNNSSQGPNLAVSQDVLDLLQPFMNRVVG